MLDNLNKTWANNHGWLLSGASLIVGLVACLIWYLDWVPQIIFSNSATKQPLVSQAIQPQSGILVAQIIGPQDSLQHKKGRILLYSGNSEPNQLPQYQEKFALDDRNMASILLVVPKAEYTVIAFIDENDNGVLDFEGDQALERFRLPRIATSEQDTENEIPAEGGLVNLQSQIPVLCTFDFVEK
jgi:hypothetical protein